MVLLICIISGFVASSGKSWREFCLVIFNFYLINLTFNQVKYFLNFSWETVTIFYCVLDFLTVVFLSKCRASGSKREVCEIAIVFSLAAMALHNAAYFSFCVGYTGFSIFYDMDESLMLFYNFIILLSLIIGGSKYEWVFKFFQRTFNSHRIAVRNGRLLSKVCDSQVFKKKGCR